ncbi:MAG: shikimate dehydrogenase [Anaerolineaceae bacterium]|nr:shikimate dehydrogenase [Anaerolineaceae bacterium]
MSDSKTTMKVGLLGWPISHSLSPVIHQSAFDDQNLNWKYKLFPIDTNSFESDIRILLQSDIRGFNITAPYKELIVPFLSTCDEIGQLLGAVNTVYKNEMDEWVGTNTDVIGLKCVLEEIGINQKNTTKVTILGNGGVSRAVLSVLDDLHINAIDILARNQRRSIQVIDAFSGRTQNWKELNTRQINDESIQNALDNSDLVINASTVGMHHNEVKTFFSENVVIHDNVKFLDLVYQPTETMMMKQVLSAGGKAWNGINMLIYQAAAAYKIWTGKDAPINVMKEAVLRRITQ